MRLTLTKGILKKRCGVNRYMILGSREKVFFGEILHNISFSIQKGVEGFKYSNTYNSSLRGTYGWFQGFSWNEIFRKEEEVLAVRW